MCNLTKSVKRNQMAMELGPGYEIVDYEERDVVNAFDKPAMQVILSAEPKKVLPWRWDFTPPGGEAARLATRHARNEGMFESRLYGDSARERRCIVLVQGFYEFGPAAKGKKTKTPFYIDRLDGGMMAMGGIWKDWGVIGGAPYQSMAIVTTPANELLTDIIQIEPRMTYHLERNGWDKWLDPATPVDEVKRMIRVCPNEWLKAMELEVSPLAKPKAVSAAAEKTTAPKVEPGSLF